MSMKTWKKEFYPVPADRCPESEAIDHSLLKWEGLKPENMEKHSVFRHGCFITQERYQGDSPVDPLWIGTDSCALCFRYFKPEVFIKDRCKTCPLFKVNGNVPCDGFSTKYNCNAWDVWTCQRDPEPMIRLLKAAKAKAARKRARKVPDA